MCFDVTLTYKRENGTSFMLLFCCCTLLEVVDSLVFNHKPSQPIFTLLEMLMKRKNICFTQLGTKFCDTGIYYTC